MHQFETHVLVWRAPTQKVLCHIPLRGRTLWDETRENKGRSVWPGCHFAAIQIEAPSSSRLRSVCPLSSIPKDLFSFSLTEAREANCLLWLFGFLSRALAGWISQVSLLLSVAKHTESEAKTTPSKMPRVKKYTPQTVYKPLVHSVGERVSLVNDRLLRASQSSQSSQCKIDRFSSFAGPLSCPDARTAVFKVSFPLLEYFEVVSTDGDSLSQLSFVPLFLVVEVVLLKKCPLLLAVQIHQRLLRKVY